MRKCYWKNGADRLAQYEVASVPQLVKNAISTPCNKVSIAVCLCTFPSLYVRRHASNFMSFSTEGGGNGSKSRHIKSLNVRQFAEFVKAYSHCCFSLYPLGKVKQSKSSWLVTCRRKNEKAQLEKLL